MDYPKTGGEALAILQSRSGKRELADVHRATGVSFSTLQNWRDSPGSRFTAKGRKKWDEIFKDGEPVVRESVTPYVSGTGPTLTDVLAAVERLNGRFDALLTLGEQGRLDATIKGKRKHGGGAA